MKQLTGLLVLIAIWVAALAVSAQGPPHIWSHSYGDIIMDSPSGLAVDSEGNIIMSGYAPDADFGGGPMATNIFLVKFNADANHIWSFSYGEPGSLWTSDITVDGGNNVILTGYFWGEVDFGGGLLASSGKPAIFLAKLDPDGGHIWSYKYGGHSNDIGRRVCVDGNDNIFLTGAFSDTLDFGGAILTSVHDDDLFLAKLDPDGNHLWSKRFGDSNPQYALAVESDQAGNVILFGQFFGIVDFGGGTLTATSGYQDIFMAKFTAAGTHLWSHRYGSTNHQYAADVAIDNADNIFITGSFNNLIDFGAGTHGSSGSSDIYLAKFNSSATCQWSLSFGDTNHEGGFGLDTDGEGNVVMVGNIVGTVDFGGDPLVTSHPLFADAFMAKFSADGAHIWSQAFGDSVYQNAFRTAIDADGNTIIAGDFESSIDLGGGVLNVTGGIPDDNDIFLAKFGVPPVGACPGSYLSLAPSGVIPTTVSASFEERGAYITALKNFEVCALGMNVELALPQEVTARIYEADGNTRGTLLAEQNWMTFLPGEVMHLVPLNCVLHACRDYEIAFEFEVSPVWSWFDERTFYEPFDIGGVIRVRDGDYAGNASNFALPNFALIGSAFDCHEYADLAPPEAVWATCGDTLVDRGIIVIPNQTMTVCGLTWIADFLQVPAPVTAKIYQTSGGGRGDLIGLGFGTVTVSGMEMHDISINAVLLEGTEYDLAIEAPGCDWHCVSENTITLPYTIGDAISVGGGERDGNFLDTLLTHMGIRWSPGSGGAAFDLGMPGGPYPPPNEEMGGSVRQGMYVTSLIDQNLYSLGWNAEVALSTVIHARVYEAGGTTRGSLMSEGSIVCSAEGMRWHDIPVAVACTTGGDYDVEIEAVGADGWRWWSDTSGLPYDVRGVIQVRDAEYGGDPGDTKLIELRMHACDASLTAVMDPVQPPKFFVGAPYPNPTAARTIIDYSLDRAGPVTITLYDVAGRRITTLLSNADHPLGPGILEFDTSALASGVYFLRIETTRKSLSRKITIIR